MTVARFEHTATRLDGTGCGGSTPAPWCGSVLVAGGSTTVETATAAPAPTAAVEIYSPGTGTWTPGAPLGAARTLHTATLLGGPACSGEGPPEWCGKVLVVGGGRVDEATPSKHRALGSAELYDPATGTWTDTGALNTPRAAHTATQLLDGRVLVAGGWNPVDGTVDARAELYDPATGTWTYTGALKVHRRSDHTATLLTGTPCQSATPPSWCGKVLVAKGRTVTGARTGEAERYDPATGEWEETVFPPQLDGLSKYDHTATLLPDGTVLAAGGFDTAARESVELYNPNNLVWSGTALMRDERADHSATLLPDGRVLTAGGYTQVLQGTTAVTVPVDGSEVYSTTTAEWAGSGSLNQGRYRHSATLLPDGRVLAAGGIGTGGPLATAELWDPAADPPPGAVTDLTAEAATHRKITLRWSAVGSDGDDGPPATDYVVKQSRQPITDDAGFDAARALCDGGVCRFTPAAVGEALVLNVTDLKPKTTYHYAVKAADAAGQQGPISNPAQARTKADKAAPGRVTDLKAKGVSGRKIRLKWSATGSDGNEEPPARLYIVKQSRKPITSNKRFRKALKLCTCKYSPGEVGDGLELLVTRLRRNTKYHYALKAKDDAGNVGKLSNRAQARTK